MNDSTHPQVEILYFDGCPNHKSTVELVKRIATETGTTIDVRLVCVESNEDAQRTRFLGSPSVRVNGRDIEPGADQRTTFQLSCRIFQHDGQLAGQPAAEWIHAALTTNDSNHRPN